SCGKIGSDPALLARAASIVRNGSHVANGCNGEACRLQGTQSRFTARAGAGDLNLERAHAMLLRLAGAILSCNLGSEGRGFARALEPLRARRRPGDGVPLGVGDGDHRVVEGRVDVSDTRRNVLALPTTNA